MIAVKMLEDIYRVTPQGWLRYSAGKTYLFQDDEAESISRQACGYFTIKPNKWGRIFEHENKQKYPL